MTSPSYSILPEAGADRPAIETLLDACFGLSRLAKTSYRFREGEKPIAGLSLVARSPSGGILGAIAFWHLRIGKQGTPAILLGPLAVDPELQGKGIGRALMAKGIAAAARQGHKLVILVGDEPYYGRVGFRPVPEGRLILPGPVDPKRLLYLELEAGALCDARGLVLPPGRFSALRGTRSARPATAAAQGSGACQTAEPLQSP